jgi:hypothetical protein
MPFSGLVGRGSLNNNKIYHGPLKLRTVHSSDNTKFYESKVSVQNVFTRCDKVVPGLGATNLLLHLLLLLLPVSEFWSFYTFSILPFLDNFFNNFLTTFFGNFWQLFGNFLATFDNCFDNFLATFGNFLAIFDNFLTTFLTTFWQLFDNFLTTF